MTNGEKNLIPLNKRTKEAQREIQSMGGTASAQARRKRKSLKESMNALLEMTPANKRDFNKLIRAGIPFENIDNSQLVVLALFNQAKSGDVAAIKELRNLIDESVENDTGKLEVLIKELKNE